MNPSSLSEQVYKYLLRQIIQGNLPPGNTLNIATLAREHGISNTPIREALTRLEFDGFVTIRPRHGVIVNVLDEEDQKNCSTMIGLVESFIILRYHDKITSSQIVRLEEINRELAIDVKHNDLLQFFQNDILFHHIYLNVCDNQLLKKRILPMKYRLQTYLIGFYDLDIAKRHHKEHNQLIKYLKAGKIAKAADFLRNKHWSSLPKKESIYHFANQIKSPQFCQFED